jgi:flagellar biosynthesis/type III secretory pathway chaperone
MTDIIDNLIRALRHELEQYGEMLALLERQKQHIGTRCAESVFETIHPIKAQGGEIQKARAHREDCRGKMAQSLQQPQELAFAQLIPLLPGDCQPLLGALVKENNELLVRVRQRARQNHLHLSRSIELMQSLINSLVPNREPRVYTERGNMKARRPASRLLYEAIG